MKCPNCNSTETVKNGRRKERQFICASTAVVSFSNPTDRGATRTMWDNCASRCTWMAWDCAALNESRTFITPPWCTGFAHAGHELTDAPASDEIPEITDLDELQTFVGKSDKKSGSGLPRITGVRASWLGLWETGVRKRSSACGGLSCWQSFWYGARWLYGLSSVHWRRFPSPSKTYMTRIEGENNCVTIWHDCTARRCTSSRLRCWVFSAFAAALSERWHRTYSRLIITFQQRSFLQIQRTSDPDWWVLRQSMINAIFSHQFHNSIKYVDKILCSWSFRNLVQ